MLKQYCSRLQDQYKQKGFTSAMKLLNETFIEYLFIELNTFKLRQISRDNNIQQYSRIFSPNLLEEIGGRRDIKGLIQHIQLNFLSGCEKH